MTTWMCEEQNTQYGVDLRGWRMDDHQKFQQLSPGEKRASEIGWEQGFEQFASALDRTRRSQ